MTTSSSSRESPTNNAYLDAILEAIPDPHDALVFAYASLDLTKTHDDPGAPLIEAAIRQLEADIDLAPQICSTPSSLDDARGIAINALYVAHKYHAPGAQVLDDAIRKLEMELALLPSSSSTSSSTTYVPMPRKLLAVWRNKGDKRLNEYLKVP